MNQGLAAQHTGKTLFRFAFPTMVMMAFMALYTMFAGFFVANYISADALAGLNIVIPGAGILASIAVWLGAGSSVVISRKLGMGRQQEARGDTTMVILLTIVLGLGVTLAAQYFAEPILRFLGSTERLHPYALSYYRMSFYFAIPCLLQVLFQFLFVASGKPKLGLFCVSAGGISELILDYVLIVKHGMGVSGAALATGIGYSIPAVVGLVWFLFGTRNPLRLTVPKFRPRMLLNSLTDGAANMIINLSGSVVTWLFNLTILRYLGEIGIAAATIVLYARFLFNSVLTGYASGVAPVISFHHGKGDTQQVKALFRISIRAILLASLGTMILCAILCKPIARLFAAGDPALTHLACLGILLFSLNYLFNGLNTFTNTLFSALGNGKVSALMAFLYTFVFLVAAIQLLPRLGLGVAGIWLAIPAAELCSAVLSVALLKTYQKIYRY